MFTFSFPRLAIAGVTMLALSACSSSSHKIIGLQRDAIPVSAVVVYSTPPAKYEKVAILKSSSRNAWRFTEKGKQQAALERLKEEAASLGANGILIERRGKENAGYLNTGAESIDANASNQQQGLPLTNETLEGLAIWVEK